MCEREQMCRVKDAPPTAANIDEMTWQTDVCGVTLNQLGVVSGKPGISGGRIEAGE
ncbi:hypothetical protein PI124_g4036 [Phytophthora idaei]|nr:hypothetical protein PI125_g4322 [Phytophthora idaei]KAG3166674.1 hypothetical protein PI126_g4121 [Phytophthora idaei]KAG3251366.1 hypothetical protein PI124_g4036 [Phytophthora idaei]